ncbi:MAG: hypothetical protein Q4D41_00440 [Prevotellaceae bacterium]|nr:hypothetical protein [Prevotellaceae bacterium]
MIKTLVIITFCLLPVSIFAQDSFLIEDKQELLERAKMKVGEFRQYLSGIVNTDLSGAQRQSTIKSALALFRGKGEAYSVENEYGEKEQLNPVRMHFFHANRQKTEVISMARFLNNLYNNSRRYGVVEIQSVDVEIIDNIYKVDSIHYKAVIHLQRFTLGENGIFTNNKTSNKKYVVDINPINTSDGIIWDAKLGDVYAISTKLY